MIDVDRPLELAEKKANLISLSCGCEHCMTDDDTDALLQEIDDLFATIEYLMEQRR